MKKRKHLHAAICTSLAVSYSVLGVLSAPTAFAETASTDAGVYSFDETVITAPFAKKTANPYLTGGNVNSINRTDIEHHNYSTVVDALKSIPGVQISTPGYRGGEYGYASFNTELSINGENNVTILVDGRRIDSDASSYSGSKSRVNLATLPSIQSIERIDVIKGTGSALYGSSAAGGVINIITRQGSSTPSTTLDVSVGSWGRQNYALSHENTSKDGTLHYAFAVSSQSGNDSEYADSVTNSTKKFSNTGFHDENASFNITKQFTPLHSLSLSYNHSYEKAHYPITAPDYRYIDAFYNGTMAAVNPATHRYTGLSSAANGYRNIFLYDAWLGSYNESMNNMVDLKYVFDKTSENAESFLRAYRNYTRYNTMDYSSLWNVPYPYLGEFWAAATSSANYHTDVEDVTGAAVQFAKKMGRHSLTEGIDYRHSVYEYQDRSGGYQSSRDAWNLYFQDKIKISNKFIFTPGINYAYYSNGVYNSTPFSSAAKSTFSGYANYDFNQNTSLYFAASQIFKPVSGLDFSRAISFDPLQNEEGCNYNAGLTHRIGKLDEFTVHYATTDMSNAIGRYSILNTSNGKWQTKAVNATRKKDSMNLGYTHCFSSSWKGGISYSWVNETFHAKNVQQNPDGSNPDELINAFRPRNMYRINVSFEKSAWFADLSYTIYSGNNTKYFTNSRFNVLDLALNYNLSSSTKLYLNVNNVLNQAYETKALASYGPGALPESGRSFMFGVKQSF